MVARCRAFFRAFSCSLPYSCFGKRGLGTLIFPDLICGFCIVFLGLFAFPLDVIGKLCSVIVALPGQFLFYLSYYS